MARNLKAAFYIIIPRWSRGGGRIAGGKFGDDRPKGMVTPVLDFEIPNATIRRDCRQQQFKEGERRPLAGHPV